MNSTLRAWAVHYGGITQVMAAMTKSRARYLAARAIENAGWVSSPGAALLRLRSWRVPEFDAAAEAQGREGPVPCPDNMPVPAVRKPGEKSTNDWVFTRRIADLEENVVALENTLADTERALEMTQSKLSGAHKVIAEAVEQLKSSWLSFHGDDWIERFGLAAAIADITKELSAEHDRTGRWQARAVNWMRKYKKTVKEHAQCKSDAEFTEAHASWLHVDANEMWARAERWKTRAVNWMKKFKLEHKQVTRTNAAYEGLGHCVDTWQKRVENLMRGKDRTLDVAAENYKKLVQCKQALKVTDAKLAKARDTIKQQQEEIKNQVDSANSTISGLAAVLEQNRIKINELYARCVDMRAALLDHARWWDLITTHVSTPTERVEAARCAREVAGKEIEKPWP